MKKRISNLFLVITCSIQLSCAGVQLIEDRKNFEKSHVVEDDSYNITIPFFRYVPTPVDIEPLCKGKEWKDLYVGRTFLGGIIYVVTLGIVEPQKVEATCIP